MVQDRELGQYKCVMELSTMTEVLFDHKYTAARAGLTVARVMWDTDFWRIQSHFPHSLGSFRGEEDGHMAWRTLLSFTTLLHPFVCHTCFKVSNGLVSDG